MARESIEVLKECEAFLEGHFLLSSGRHSGAYCQMAYLQQYPDKCAEVMAHVAEKLKDTDVDVIVGPAMGGICLLYTSLFGEWVEVATLPHHQQAIAAQSREARCKNSRSAERCARRRVSERNRRRRHLARR